MKHNVIFILEQYILFLNIHFNINIINIIKFDKLITIKFREKIILQNFVKENVAFIQIKEKNVIL